MQSVLTEKSELMTCGLRKAHDYPKFVSGKLMRFSYVLLQRMKDIGF